MPDPMPSTAASGRRYLDNAATSWPKPPEVWAASEQAARTNGAAAGRAAYREAVVADGIRDRCRVAAAAVLGASDPARLALPGGATLALNMAIHGLVSPGDHVIATAADHNATLRPLHWLESRGVIDCSIVPCDAAGAVDPAAIARAWRPATRLVVCSHASNVTGTVQDAAAIAAIAHDRDGILLLDASQSLGQIPGAGVASGADVVVAPSHKWLLGPVGLGLLWARPGIDLDPILQGGTGTASDSLAMPETFTDALEPGMPDLPALAGLAAALDWLDRESIDAVGRGARSLAATAADGLRAIRGVRVLGAEAVGVGAPIVSFTVEGYDPAEVATVLEQTAGVQVRSGFHCAACIHEHLGTREGGTVRASFGPFNTRSDVEMLVEMVERLATG